MTKNKEDHTFTLTVPVRMTFVNLIAPRAFKPGAEPKFGATFLLPQDNADVPGLKNLISRVYSEAFPGKAIEGARVPLRSGESQADRAKARGKDFELARGNWVMGASSGYQPVLSVILNGKWTDLTDDDDLITQYGGQFYSGTDARASFFFKKYEITETNWGVTAYLQNVASYNRGTKLGTASGASRFGEVTGHVTEENPEAAVSWT